MKERLKRLSIIQEVSNEGRSPKLGKVYFTAHRLNPYNPLSYIFFITALIIGIILFGFVGVWEQMDNRNPFKWN